MLKTELPKAGHWLFRWRSYAPLPLFAVALLLVVFHGPDEMPGRTAFELGCLALSLLGLAIRLRVLGTVSEKTSGRNTRSQVAEELNADGLYSLVRHPLYLGNFFIYLGVALFPGVWWLPVFFALLFWVYIERIMFAEEDFLEQQFGDAFRAWAAATPAFVPRFSRWQPSSRPYRLRQALRRDRSAILGVALVFALLVTAQRGTAATLIGPDLFWGALALAGVVLYAIGKLIRAE